MDLRVCKRRGSYNNIERSLVFRNLFSSYNFCVAGGWGNTGNVLMTRHYDNIHYDYNNNNNNNNNISVYLRKRPAPTSRVRRKVLSSPPPYDIRVYYLPVKTMLNRWVLRTNLNFSKDYQIIDKENFVVQQSTFFYIKWNVIYGWESVLKIDY